MEYAYMLKKKEEECILAMQTDYSQEGCETMWDGMKCWPRTKVNETAIAPCPDYIYGINLKEYATKLCTDDGWQKKDNLVWTNYSRCLTEHSYVTMPPFASRKINDTLFIQEYLPTVQLISESGYTISLVTLLLAFSILAFNKKLKCPRNQLHLHAFASFIMRASMTLLKVKLFVHGLGLPNDVILIDGVPSYTLREHGWTCKLFMISWQYSIMASYSWILMEGIYLHNLIFMALLDKSSIIWHVLLGWTLPAVFVALWATLRSLYEDNFCWTIHANRNYFLAISIPTVTSYVINFLLFLNITRVLLSKLNSSTSRLHHRRISKYRKGAKSTLVLMPLYGVHYALFMGLSYSENAKVELVYLFCDQLFASYQGFFVALLYCLLNQEVREGWETMWNQYKNKMMGRNPERSIISTVGVSDTGIQNSRC